MSNVPFAATALPAAFGASSLDSAAAGVALVLFSVSIVVWVWAFGLAVVRSARGDDIAVASLFFLQGSAPRAVKVHLFGSLTLSVTLAVVTAGAEPFGVLVPMLPLGLAGLWAARHGAFPARPQAAPAEHAPRPGRSARRTVAGAPGRSRDPHGDASPVGRVAAGGSTRGATVRTRSRAARGRNGRGRSSQ